jgi:hypothetical protein
VLLSFLLSPALAGQPGYYHPDDIAAASARFAEAAEAMGPAFERAQTTLGSLGRDLEELERNTALLGDDAGEALESWYTGTQRSVTGQYLQIQRHVDLLQDDYANVFTVAVEQAIARVGAGRELAECTKSGGVSSMLRRSTAGSATCKGEDVNAAIAAAIDADTALSAAVREINAVPWPALSVTPAAQPVHPVTGTVRYVSLSPLARRYVDDRADARLEAFEDALSPLEDAISEGDQAAIDEAGRLKDVYRAGLAEDGAALQAALRKSLVRAGKQLPGFAEVGLCANPDDLGGCTGEDITVSVAALLRDDRKFQKAMDKL